MPHGDKSKYKQERKSDHIGESMFTFRLDNKAEKANADFETIADGTLVRERSMTNITNGQSDMRSRQELACENYAYRLCSDASPDEERVAVTGC